MRMNATAAEDAETQFQTGMAMLAGTALSPDWKKAVGYIDAAAAAGHAQAIERRALLECRGMGRESNWDKALDSLVIAAEAGSQSAAQQLILLADNRYEPAALTVPLAGGWGGMRSRISIAPLRPAHSASDLSRYFSVTISRIGPTFCAIPPCTSTRLSCSSARVFGDASLSSRIR